MASLDDRGVEEALQQEWEAAKKAGKATKKDLENIRYVREEEAVDEDVQRVHERV